MKNTNLLLICFLTLLVNLAIGQNIERDVVSANGDMQVSNNVEVSWTIGEVVVESYFQEDVNIVSGYQQPEVDSLEFVIEKLEKSVLIFPNPFFNYFFISFNERLDKEIQLHLLSNTGQNVKRLNLKKGMKVYKFEGEDMESGAYELLFLSGNEVVSVQKILKIK
jgi:hypothetical protein